MKDLVKSRIEYILHKHFLINENVILNSYHKLGQMDLNQMEQMELLWYVEREFDIEFTDNEVINVQTIGDLIQFTTSHLSKAYCLAA